MTVLNNSAAGSDIESAQQTSAVEETQQRTITGADVLETLVSSTEAQESETERLKREKMEDLQNKYLLTMSDEFPPEECLMELHGISFLAKGDIHAIKAKQKQGKSHTIAIMIATLLGCNYFSIKGKLSNPKVIYFDTEQKPADTQDIYRKVLSMAGLPQEDCLDRLQFWTIESMPFGEMMTNVKFIVEYQKPDVVFIDGFVDLLENFNDIDTSKKFVNETRSMATTYDCAIMGVLHTNKDPNDHNMRGHAGTMLAQKCALVLECSKDDSNNVTVKCTDSRKVPLADWSFTWDEDSNLIPADDIVAQQKAKAEIRKQEEKALKKQKEVEARFAPARDIMKGHPGSMLRAELAALLVERTGKSRTTCSNLITSWIKSGKLIEVAEDYVALPV